MRQPRIAGWLTCPIRTSHTAGPELIDLEARDWALTDLGSRATDPGRLATLPNPDDSPGTYDREPIPGLCRPFIGHGR